MFEFAPAFIGLFYIVAQWLLAMTFQGYWRIAAYVPVPLLAVLIIGAVALGGVLHLDTAAMLVLGLPAALVYLTLLSGMHFAARMIHAR